MHPSEDSQGRDSSNDVPRNTFGTLEAVEEINTPQWPTAVLEKAIKTNVSSLEGSTTSMNSESQADVRLYSHFRQSDRAEYAAKGMEKRLPTLPNTPSSAYPVSEIEDSPMHGIGLPKAPIGKSHFSVTTIDTNESRTDSSAPYKSHFSTWTTSSDQSSAIMSGSSFAHIGSDMTEFERSPDLSYSSDGNSESPQLRQHPTLEVHDSHIDVQIGSLPQSGFLTSSASHTSFGTSPDEASRSSKQFPGLGLDLASDFRHLIRHGVSVLPSPPKTQQTYQLPLIPQSKFAMSMNPDVNQYLNTHQQSSSRDWRPQQEQPVRVPESNVVMPHIDSMKELLDEIGYLRNLIGTAND